MMSRAWAWIVFYWDWFDYRIVGTNRNRFGQATRRPR